MKMKAFNNPIKELEKIFSQKGITNKKSAEENIGAGPSEDDNDDEWDLVLVRVTAYVESIISNDTWNDIVGGEGGLLEQTREFFDANEKLDVCSDQSLFIDFCVSDIAEVLKHTKEKSLTVLSIFEPELGIKEELKKKEIGVYFMIPKKAMKIT